MPLGSFNDLQLETLLRKYPFGNRCRTASTGEHGHDGDDDDAHQWMLQIDRGARIFEFIEVADDLVQFHMNLRRIVQPSASYLRKHGGRYMNYSAMAQVYPDYPKCALALGLGAFDYVISHGLYSWVPEAVRDKIMDVYRRCLKRDGVGYISYNTLPGWHMRGMIRDMMCYHASRFPGQDPGAQVGGARALLHFLADSVQGEKNPYALLLRHELSLLSDKPDSYLYHDQMETHNDAFYFFQFCKHLNDNGLAYLGETNVNSMAAFGYPDKVQKGLQELAGPGKPAGPTMAASQVEMEQYLDFLFNRTFRQTLICHDRHRPNYAVSPEVVSRFHIAAGLRPENGAVDLGPDINMVYTSPDGSKLETRDPIVKAAAQCLLEAWPQALAFAELAPRSRALLNPWAAVDPVQAREDAAVLSKLILPGYLRGGTKMFELWQCRPRFVAAVSDRPAASAYARWQATRQEKVANLRHEFCTLGAFTRKLLPLVDGTRDQAALADELVGFHDRGEINVDVRGQSVKDRPRARELLAQSLKQELAALARSALLVS